MDGVGFKRQQVNGFDNMSIKMPYNTTKLSYECSYDNYVIYCLITTWKLNARGECFREHNQMKCCSLYNHK